MSPSLPRDPAWNLKAVLLNEEVSAEVGRNRMIANRRYMRLGTAFQISYLVTLEKGLAQKRLNDGTKNDDTP